MSETDYRVEYSIQRQRPGESDFTEIGFGSSGAWSDLDGCVHMIGAALQNGEWETEAGQPDPDDVMHEIEEARSDG